MEATHPTTEAPQRPREDWFDESYVNYWIDQQEARAAERHRQFVMVRSLIPKPRPRNFAT